jgi:aryl-alcohol dehydrogenase-like predicted oxidoreductase
VGPQSSNSQNIQFGAVHSHRGMQTSVLTDAAHQQVLTAAASRHSANTSQIALAWLLAVSPVTLPIPGTATPAHLEDNMAAAALQLEQDEIHAITAAASSATQRATQAT